MPDGSGQVYIDGVRLVTGCLSSDAKTKAIQAVLFDKAKWNADKASVWLGEQGLKSDDLEEGKASLRYNQRDYSDFTHCRVIKVKPDVLGRYMGDEPAAMSLETGDGAYHRHGFMPTASYTEHPKGMYDGHRHEILRDGAGRVTGFGESEGHGHPLPIWVQDHPNPDYRSMAQDDDEDKEYYKATGDSLD